MGSVSQRLLVLLTLMPRRSIMLHARSISATRSPILLPKAIYAVILRGPLLLPLPHEHAQPQAERFSPGIVAQRRGRTEGIRHGEAEEAKARLEGYAALRVMARLRISEREGKGFLMAIFSSLPLLTYMLEVMVLE